MAGINYPLWTTLKENVKTALEAIATEETAISTARSFSVVSDRWRPYIESESQVALVNIMVQAVSQDSDRSGSKRNSLDDVEIVIDMYVIGGAGELLPSDEFAAKRLDLLTAQVREGLTRLAGQDFGMIGYIDRSLNMSLSIYDQESETSTGQYAPARWTMNVQTPFIPTDNNSYNDLTELNIDVKESDLEVWAVRFTY